MGVFLNVLFLIEGWIAPAPRFRVLQYLPYLVDKGVHFQVRALHGHSYPFFYHWPVLGALYKGLVRLVRRWYHLRDAEQFDVVFQQRLSLPFSSFLERRLVKKNPHLVFDFDDALFQTERGANTRRHNTFTQVVALAQTVLAGSDYLASHAGKGCLVIPTVIDTNYYQPGPTKNANRLVIGWMGTHSNFANFAPILPALLSVLENFPFVDLQIVSDRAPPFSLPRTSFIRWDKDRELALLQGFHLGIMPLIDNDWNRGKCAFKLIQYMAVAIPVVAGRVGANIEVVSQGVTGHLASSVEEWTVALSALIEDSELRQRLGEQGRIRCIDRYSLVACREKLLAALKMSARSSGAL